MAPLRKERPRATVWRPKPARSSCQVCSATGGETTRHRVEERPRATMWRRDHAPPCEDQSLCAAAARSSQERRKKWAVSSTLLRVRQAALQNSGTAHFYSVFGTQNYKSMCPLTSSNSQLNYYKHQMSLTGLIFKCVCLKISHFYSIKFNKSRFLYHHGSFFLILYNT